MVDQQRNCSGLDIDEGRDGAEFRSVVNALFCACLAARDARVDRLPRELFRRVELEHQSLADAAGELGLSIPEGREILGKARRDIAVLMALGLCIPAAGQGDGSAPKPGCGCRDG